jgi:protein-S-isoprenylcysteine O-methyltransferase Ste14
MATRDLLGSAGERDFSGRSPFSAVFFRRDVTIQEGHRVVTAGPYRVIRHPSYTANLAVAAGLGFAFVTWASLAVLLVVPFLGHLPRIHVEESELQRALSETST